MSYSNRYWRYGFILLLAFGLAACSSSPKKASNADMDAEIEAAMATKGEPPKGFDASAPNENPYLTQDVNVPGAAQSLFNSAVTAMQNNDWQKAEVLLQELTTTYPDLSGPFLNLGITYRHLDNYTAAETAFRNAIAANALNLDAYNQLGLLLREQGRFDEAEQEYLAAIKVWPKHADSHKNIGILYDLYLGQYDKALNHFEIYQYLQTEPDRQVAGWIIDLKRRIGAGGQS